MEAELRESISKEFQEKLKQKNTKVDTLTGINSQDGKKPDGWKEPSTPKIKSRGSPSGGKGCHFGLAVASASMSPVSSKL